MRMGIKIFDGQRLHVRKQIVPQIPQNSLRHIDHNAVVDISRRHTDQIESGHPHDGSGKRSEIRLLCRQHRLNIIVDQTLNKHRSLYICQHTDKDQHCNDDQVRSIAFRHIFHQPLKDFTRIFYFLAFRHSASHWSRHCLPLFCAAFSIWQSLRMLRLRRPRSDPICYFFSSKSPLPLVWDSYTSR